MSWFHFGQFNVIGDVARDAFWSGGLLVRPAENDGATIHVWEPEEIDPTAMGLERVWEAKGVAAGSES